MNDVCVLITAAGSSTRMQELGDKLALKVAGKTVLAHSVGAFLAAGLHSIFVAVPQGSEEYMQTLLGSHQVTFVAGGRTRQESVCQGLKAIPPSFNYVLIHDGARPFVSQPLIARVVAATKSSGAAVPGISLNDTVYIAEAGQVETTLRRDKLVAVQTPQGFDLQLVKDAHSFAAETGAEATDDSALVMAIGHKVAIVEGERENVKITTVEDYRRSSAALLTTRIGFGMDTHRLVAGRKLVLAGVRIPCAEGLLGHSDADVVAHAVMDALLGAMGLGDIGEHFPDTEERYRGADSLTLLRQVVCLLTERGARPQQVDITLLLESPKIAPFKSAMRANMAEALGIAVDSVNIKATTNEGLGYIGEGQGATCYAVATVSCTT
ncbi:MAG: 2-C-methyl-D-erythritol 4-phosphate cytidylyltransferase [Firmicutes bacterium]|nr:2-C-methyl-D-erythritol 4-phosphate cytidylyltransferase [Dethiobacter sp.]MBS3889141.1 2-C-methyl-D-erythritol 4-phosphate cytidylyltransferase [Bacillota bacterium]